MDKNEKWEEFLKSGSVLSYLSYASEKNKMEGESKYENSNSGTDSKGNQYR